MEKDTVVIAVQRFSQPKRDQPDSFPGSSGNADLATFSDHRPRVQSAVITKCSIEVGGWMCEAL